MRIQQWDIVSSRVSQPLSERRGVRVSALRFFVKVVQRQYHAVKTLPTQRTLHGRTECFCHSLANPQPDDSLAFTDDAFHNGVTRIITHEFPQNGASL